MESARRARVSLPPEAPLPSPAPAPFPETRVQVTNETTFLASRRLVDAGHRPLALNFANGIHPGGGFLHGSRAQEEVLCRSSALHSTLVGDPMYAAHRQRSRPDSTDWAILSPDVPVFRTDDGTELEQPWLLSFLTCAAPVAKSIGQPESGVLHVAQPQLFHFAVSAGSIDAPEPAAVMMTLTGPDRQELYRVVARPGETRTSSSVLLAPGYYSVQVHSLTLEGSPLDDIAYSIRGLSVSQPIAVVPTDPTQDPVSACPGVDEEFCYPDGTQASTSFLWLDSVYSPELSAHSTMTDRVTFALADWWSWYWEAESEDSPPQSSDDAYRTSPEQPLRISAVAGLLANEMEPEDRRREPRVGAGDANADGRFDQFDIITVLQKAKYNILEAATWAEGDWTGDGFFDQHDIVAALQIGNYVNSER